MVGGGVPGYWVRGYRGAGSGGTGYRVRVVVVPGCTVPGCTVLYRAVLYWAMLYCTVLGYAVLYCTGLCCTVPGCTVLYPAVLNPDPVPGPCTRSHPPGPDPTLHGCHSEPSWPEVTTALGIVFEASVSPSLIKEF